MTKTHLLFDLDGTIIDPKIGITSSVRYALTRFDIDVPDADALTPFIGPPLRESFRHYYGMSAEEAEQAVVFYREYFSRQGIRENTMYPGMEALLREEHARGRTLVLATSKATVYAEEILRHWKLDRYFSFTAGSEWDGTRSQKGEVVRYALESQGIQADKALMIGDRKHDVLGARENGLDSVGVLYGYGGRAELEAAGATWLAETVEILREILHTL